MTKRHDALEALADRLERNGAEPARVDIVRRAERFKRSWVELAEGLWSLRKGRKYEAWGYSELHEYCQKELHIKPVTVDKLMLSYGTLRSHAPEVLKRDGVSREIPTLEAVDYFSRALPPSAAEDGESIAPGRRRLDAPAEVLDELRSAVFDEAQSLGELRKRFDPLLRPKSAREEEADVPRKAKALAERLAETVQATTGLSEKRVARVVAMVEALVRDLDELIEKNAQAKGRKGKAA
ncbi:MAG TPA: hypothetical protein VJV78_00020 [Polyangiales bacterium]|nr:hypothetical protein [Polyangiales bacterium]